jgi:hypothetical protein
MLGMNMLRRPIGSRSADTFLVAIDLGGVRACSLASLVITYLAHTSSSRPDGSATLVWGLPKVGPFAQSKSGCRSACQSQVATVCRPKRP